VTRRSAVLFATIAAMALMACDSDGESADVPGGADPESASVIDEWATTLAAGDVEAAAELFAIPSVAQNGGLEIEIETADDARFFNASLPCGAELTRAEAEGELTIATFVLKERPGPGSCGEGTGMTAKTAFVIEDGEIVEWRRIDDGGPGAAGTPA
jgi:hypothetical protein